MSETCVRSSVCAPSLASNRWQEGLTLARELGYAWGTATCLLNLGNLSRQQGNLAEAHRWLIESLETMQSLGDQIGIAYALEGLGFVATRHRQPTLALRLFAAATGLRSKSGAPLADSDQNEFDHFVATARQALAGDVAANAWAEGQQMPQEKIMEQALNLALS